MIRYKKPTIQLTSILDLLFIMIFLSLLQTKQVAAPVTKVKSTAVKKPPVMRPTKAIFSFYAVTRNPKLPSGSYEMGGSFNRKTGELKLGGVSWINQPSAYEMIPLKGKINVDEMKLVGKIEFTGCKQFTLIKTSNMDSTDIKGEWTGEYTCLQGPTGLSLIIK